MVVASLLRRLCQLDRLQSVKARKQLAGAVYRRETAESFSFCRRANIFFEVKYGLPRQPHDASLQALCIQISLFGHHEKIVEIPIEICNQGCRARESGVCTRDFNLR